MTDICFMLMGALFPFAVIFAFLKGYQTGRAVLNGERRVPAGITIRGRTKKDDKETLSARIIHDNIENYGTNTPQKEVEQ